MIESIFLKYGVSLAVGILIGMQREYAIGQNDREISAGVRTVALIGICGCLSAQISDLTGSVLPLAVCMAILGAFLVSMYRVDAQRGHTGLTTEVASLLAFLAGALAYHDRLALAGALGVVTTTILSLKPELHSIARKLTREDLTATLKFALLGAVFLPILPDRSYFPAPFDVLNPFVIGLFVVLMSAVGFLGYALSKTSMAEKGFGLMGMIGGLVSSTAVTFGFTQRSRMEPGLSRTHASAIFASWAVMFARTLVVVASLDLEVGLRIWIPIAAAMAAAAINGLLLHRRKKETAPADSGNFTNPFELGPALGFGCLFALILVASRSAQFFFGPAGILISSFAGGLVDIDAISISATRLAGSPGMGAGTAAHAVLLAALANTLLKGAFSLVAGSRELRMAMFPGIISILVAACLAAWAISETA